MKAKTILLSSIFILLVISGCGTRKASVERYLANVEISETSKVSLDSSEKLKTAESSTAKTGIKSENDITQKDTRTEVKEVFKDGELAERTTVTTVSDKIDKSTATTSVEKSESSTSVRESLKTIEKTASKVVDSLIRNRHREIDSDRTVVRNFGGWPVMILVIVALLFFIWFWAKKRI